MALSLIPGNDDYSLYQAAMMQRGGRNARRFDEYYRCYPISMLPGPDRDSVNHGGKVFLPASALEKLTRLHITYPMLFEIVNGAKEKQTHAGVLEFVAEEGKIHLPKWLMQTLLLEAGDLVQVKSTDLPPGDFIKLQPQSPDFLDISDPKAVLENAFRNFSCLTVNDVFSFAYNDTVYEIEVLEVKPDTSSHAICTMETDLSVDFAPPVGYKEPPANRLGHTMVPVPRQRSTSRSKIQTQGTMADAINWDRIRPASRSLSSEFDTSSFRGEGHRLASRRPSRLKTVITSGTMANNASHLSDSRNHLASGAQPFQLAPDKLFFGWDFTPLRTKEEKQHSGVSVRFQGIGHTLRGKKVDSNADIMREQEKVVNFAHRETDQTFSRTLRENPP